MSDTIHLRTFDPCGQPAVPRITPASDGTPARQVTIGRVTEISGSGARIEIDQDRLAAIALDPDPSVAMSGQVGSQVKLESGKHWLLANVRALKVAEGPSGKVMAEIDFLGEGDEDVQSGRMSTSSAASPPIRSPATAFSRSPATI